MREPARRPRGASDTPTFLLLVVTGFLLLVLSILIDHWESHAFWSALTRELGIVFFAVFTISLLYERWLASKYEKHFLDELRALIEQGESNGAICAYLGIQQIIATRDRFEQLYPLRTLVRDATDQTTIRVVGRSLFLLLTHPPDLKKALSRGASLELCLLDPLLPPRDLRLSPDVEPKDITAALSVFETHIRAWLDSELPAGTITIKCHTFSLLDSLFHLSDTSNPLCAWELSFGRDLSSKRIFVLDPEKPIGLDLLERYEWVWQKARPLFEYRQGAVVCDELASL